MPERFSVVLKNAAADEPGLSRFDRRKLHFLSARPTIHSDGRRAMAERIVDPQILYYREIFRKKILQTTPVACSARADFELHILVCKADFLDSLWALKTFYYFSALEPALVVHSDGSLSSKHVKLFGAHFIGSKFIDRPRADRALRTHLKGFPCCAAYRFCNPCPQSIKLFDSFFFSKSDKILILDSDVLFFKRPAAILHSILAGRGFFLNDTLDAYSLSSQEIMRTCKIAIRKRVNSGLLYVPGKKYYDLTMIEKYLAAQSRKVCAHPSWIEQTAFAVLISRHRGSFQRLGKVYGIARRNVSNATVCHHFVSGASRRYFYTRGLRRLDRMRFLIKQRLSGLRPPQDV